MKPQPASLISFYPWCSKRTRIREESSLPAKDELVTFLMRSSQENDVAPKCSNCDRNERSQIFFCNTCGRFRVG